MYEPLTPPSKPSEYLQGMTIGKHLNEDGDIVSDFVVEYEYFYTYRNTHVEIATYDVIGTATQDEIKEAIQLDL